jgi:hypothetical protein
MSDQVKLLIAYDVITEQESTYRRFVLEEFLPQAQAMGLMPSDAWHTSYGDYPSRLLGFVAEELETVLQARESAQWQQLVQKLENYTRNLSQRVVPLRTGFQW